MGKVRELRRIPLSSLSYGPGHDGWLFRGPDVRSENKKAEARGKKPPPIEVEPHGRGYRVLDGHDRWYFAGQRGDTHIMAYVWVEVAESVPGATSCGCLVATLAMMGGAVGLIAGAVALARHVI